jgi:hypothetical protein
MQQHAVPVDGQHLGWAKSAYAAAGVPIVQIVALPGGGYAIVIMAPAGAPVPDWRGMPTYKRAPWYRRIDIGAWVPRLLIFAALAAVGWMLVNGAPAAVASLLPGAGEPLVNIVAPDASDIVGDLLAPVGEAVDTATRVAMGVLALAVGLVVLWLLWTFRGTLGGIAGMLRRTK